MTNATEQDLDLIIAVNEARNPEELDRAIRAAKARGISRAHKQGVPRVERFLDALAVALAGPSRTLQRIGR